MPSSNPFRSSRTSSGSTQGRLPLALDLSSIEPSATPPPRTTFQQLDSSGASSHPEEDDDSDANPSSLRDKNKPKKKSKVIKKVRVLSPPPLSPDSPEWPFHAPPPRSGSSGTTLPSLGSSNINAAFMNNSSGTYRQPDETNSSAATAPANPFGKTLEDLENTKKEEQLEEERREEGEALKAANEGKKGMDVDSFKRLLLTGSSGRTEGEAMDAQKVADANAALNASNATTVADLNPDAEPRSTESTSKKPRPPPPSSRHGKSLRIDAADAAQNSPVQVSSPIEAPAGMHNSTAPNAGAEEVETTQPAAKKPVPAPPPARRGHGRGESRVLQADTDEQQLGHPSTTKSEGGGRAPTHVPAPPPPRRPNPSPKQDQLQPATTQPPSSTTTSTEVVTPSGSDSSQSYHNTVPPPPPPASKHGPPAPPPARNSSVRRPPSINSIDSGSRRSSGEHRTRAEGFSHATSAPPPPPPSRSRSSNDGSRPSRSSLDKMSRPMRTVNDVSVDEEGLGPGNKSKDGLGEGILADLSALQKEVDALRGKLN